MVKFASSFHGIDLVVMDAKEFLDRMDQQRIDSISYSLKEQEEEKDDGKDDLDEIHRDSVCVGVGFSSDSQSFEGHNDSVLSVAFNPVIPFQLATGGQDDKAFLLTISEEEKPSVASIPLEGHQDSVCCVSFSSNGEYLATCDMNGVIKVWSSRSGELVKSLEGPEEPEWIRWHNKSNVLMASGNDYSVWSWSLPTGTQLPVALPIVYLLDAERSHGHGDVRDHKSLGTSETGVSVRGSCC